MHTRSTLTHSLTYHDVLPLNLRLLLGELLALELEAETEGGRGQQIKTMQSDDDDKMRGRWWRGRQTDGRGRADMRWMR